MADILFCAVICFCCIYSISSTSTVLNIHTECFKDEHIYTVNEENSYILEWTKGTLISSSYCDVQFHGKGEETLDDYKVCFEALEYSIEDCEVYLKYRDTTNLPYDKLYSCSGSLPEKWCTDENDYTRIVVTGANRAHRSSFKIKITGVKTYDYYNIVGAVAGGTITGVIVVGVGVALVVFCILRRKRRGIKKPGHAHNTTPTNQLTGPSVSRLPENKGIIEYGNKNIIEHDKQGNINVTMENIQRNGTRTEQHNQGWNNRSQIHTEDNTKMTKPYNKRINNETELHNHENSKPKQHGNKNMSKQDRHIDSGDMRQQKHNNKPEKQCHDGSYKSDKNKHGSYDETEQQSHDGSYRPDKNNRTEQYKTRYSPSPQQYTSFSLSMSQFSENMSGESTPDYGTPI